MTDLPLRVKGLAILAVPLLLLAAAVLASIAVANSQNSYSAAARRSLKASDQGSALLISLLDGETGVRGYLATGNEVFLQPWHTATAAVPGQLAALGASRQISATDRDTVQAATHTVMTRLRDLITRRQSGSIPRGVLNADLLASKASMDQLRAWVTGFHNTVQRALIQRRARVSDLRTEAEVIAIAGLFAGLLGVLGMFEFIRRVARRIDEVKVAAQRLGIGESLPPTHSRSQDEIGRLATELRQASDLLTSRSGDLVTAHRGALTAVQEKNAYLSHLGHELRTPLTAIAGFGQLLSTSTTLRPEDADCVEQIVLATNHLITLTDEVNGAGLDQDPLPLNAQPVAVGEIAGEVAALMGPIAADRRVRIAVDVSPDAVARADPQRLSQVLINLVSNAIKYNRVGGQVRIGAEVIDSQHLRLAISDTGVGIAEDLQPRVFARLDRLGAEDSNIEGSGIGLALSRAYVEAMGGAIGVESTKGAGSTFWVDLVPDTPAQQTAGSHGPRPGPATGPAITAFGTRT